MKIKYNPKSMKKAALALGFQESQIPEPRNPESWTLLKHIGDTTQYISHFKSNKSIINSRYIAGQVTQEELEKIMPLYPNTNLQQWQKNTLGRDIQEKQDFYEELMGGDIIFTKYFSSAAAAIASSLGLLFYSTAEGKYPQIFSSIEALENISPGVQGILSFLAIGSAAAVVGYSIDMPIVKDAKSKASTLENKVLVGRDVKYYLQTQLNQQ